MKGNKHGGIGIAPEHRKRIAGDLGRLLADTYLLQLKTQNYHWNVTGPMFVSLHALFEEQYTQLAAAVDLLAERIRALGEPAPGSFRQFKDLASVKEDDELPEAREMVRLLAECHELCARDARKAIPHADEAGDDVTADLLTERLQEHEKTVWMLRAILG
jgi:starvation-inducible DNA-binding protein